MPEACLLLRWVEWYLARHICCGYPLDFEYEKETVEGTYYEYILTDTIANIQIISLTAYDESHHAGTDVNELFMNYPLRQEDQLTDYKYGYMYGTVFYKITPYTSSIRSASV